jgi:hypothetical protein
MDISEIKEIKGIERITINPGEQSKVIKRDTSILLIAGVDGCGEVRTLENKGGWIVSPNYATHLSFRDGSEFVIKVAKAFKVSLIALVQKIELTKKS